MSDVVIEMTPFIYEDGKTYYFKIYKRESSNEFHDLYVYKKEVIKRKFLWWKWENTIYDRLNDRAELVSTRLDTYEIKRDIGKILNSKIAICQLKNWDGFVGNIPDDIKKSLKRDSKLDDLLK
jgi:hypothetical protein